jgi:hypothetical protein
MNASDPEYQIVVAMAENLVPDVCVLVMEFLEDIHILVGRQEWRKKMDKINEEYLNNKLREIDDYIGYVGYITKSKFRRAGFMFNWRNYLFTKGNGWISNLKGNSGCETSYNF